MNKSASLKDMEKDLLFVGSVPLDTSEEVFRLIGDSGLSAAAPCLPDGEVGERQYWIVGLGYRVYHGHPDIETVNRPAPINGIENWRATSASDNWTFRVKDGVTEIHFGDPGWRLGYARDALNSYFVFKTLREEGAISNQARFQVCLPLTYSGIGTLFRDIGDWPVMSAAYEEAMAAEVAMIVAKIPHEDLAIQWDFCVELGMIEGGGAKSGHGSWNDLQTPPAALIGASIAHMSPLIPPEVMLGFHLCYGTLGGWPMRPSNDLDRAVDAVHLILDRAGRRVDFVHIPILDNVASEYFTPLQNLNHGDTKIYFGVIHNMSDLGDFRNKITRCAQYLDDFGVAAPCGFGRYSAAEMAAVIEDHQTALQILNEMRA